MCLGALPGEHSLKVARSARSARAVQRFPLSAGGSDSSSSSAGSTEIPSQSKKYRRAAVHSQKEVVEVDAMSSDACLVRMLSEGEYGVHTSSKGQTLFLPFFCMCLCCGWVHWHLLCWGWGETSGCPTLWGCSMVCIGKNVANCSKNPQFLPVMCALCPRCARAVHTRPPRVPEGKFCPLCTPTLSLNPSLTLAPTSTLSLVLTLPLPLPLPLTITLTLALTRG